MPLSHSHLGKEVPTLECVCICLFIVAVDGVTQMGFQLAILLPQLPEGHDDNAPSPVF